MDKILLELGTNKPIPGSVIPITVLDMFKAMIPVKVGDLYSATETIKGALANAPLRGANAVYSNNDIKAIIYNTYEKQIFLGRMFGLLTPLGLYAFKEKYNIKYNSWNKSDPWIKYFIGKTLEREAYSSHGMLYKQEALANVSVRMPGIMILDPDDWDLVPDSMDCAVLWQ